MKIIRILFFAGLFLCSVNAPVLAQQQYYGGNGGGYSSLTTEDIVLAIEDVLALGTVPGDFQLYQNYPNPFNPTTTISFSIPERANLSLKVFDLLGSEVEELVKGEIEAGEYEINFNASNLPSGFYFYRIQADNYTETKKMVLMK